METILSLYKNTAGQVDPDKTAIRWVDSRLKMTRITWKQFASEASLRAAYLKKIGCQPGQHIFIFLDSSIEIWYFFWGAIQCGAVPCVLFPDFGADALKSRLDSGKADFLIINQFHSKTQAAILACSTIQKIVLLESGQELSDARICNFIAEEVSLNPFTPFVPTPSDAAFMVFTSGSTGFPKAVIHTHQCAEAILRSMQHVLQVSEQDIYWCTAHPAWITGTVYGIIGPILAGVESIQYSGNFHAKRWLPVLQDQQVTVWYSAPTAFRSLMTNPDSFFSNYDLSHLRSIYSVGEPLNSAVYHWGNAVLQREIYDTWFQTEAGTIRIANLPGDTIQPGSMGHAVDDAEPFILNDQDAECRADEIGRLCLKAGWQSCFSDYYGQHSAYESKFHNGFYQTGDLAYRDPTGRFFFVGRDDDVINTSGHLVGPFEVESILLEQSEITEAGVVAAPDPLLYEKVAAFIALKPGVEWNTELETKLRIAVTTGLSPHATPKEFIVLKELPKNSAGKILRNELRKRFTS